MKRVVWTAVVTRKQTQVINAEEFAQIATEMCKATHTHLFLKEAINKFSSKLGLDECFKKAWNKEDPLL